MRSEQQYETSRRTGVDPITILRCRLCTVEKYEWLIETLDALGIANDLSSTSVVNCGGLFNHWPRDSVYRHSDQIEICLPVTLSRQRTHQNALDNYKKSD